VLGWCLVLGLVFGVRCLLGVGFGYGVWVWCLDMVFGYGVWVWCLYGICMIIV
jgi:hypothetical protein